MKRGFALALLFLATSVVVSAQAHGGAGGHASAGASRGGASRAGASSFGMRGFAGVTPSRPGGGIAFGHHPSFITGSRGRGPYRRYYPGSGYYYYPYYWPYYGYYPYYDNSDSYDSNAYQGQQAPEPPPDDYYGGASDWRNTPRPAQAAPASAPEEQEPTVLVFRDGRQLEVHNYAIVGQTLWDLSSKGTQKIPLAELDLDATRKLNDERGTDFVLPKT
jgi:hypothetical protein